MIIELVVNDVEQRHAHQLCLRAMGFFDLAVSVLHRLAEGAESKRARERRDDNVLAEDKSDSDSRVRTIH